MTDKLSDKEINDLLEAVSKEEYRDKDYSVLEGMERDSISKIRTAFDKGYKQGYETGVASQGFTDGYTEEEVEKREKEAHQKGLNETWEIARKILADDFDCEGVFGEILYANIFEKFTPSEAIAKIKEYKQKQDEIKVGDEVIHEGLRVIITNVDDEWISGIEAQDGSAHCDFNKADCMKTSRHFDQIEEVLKALEEGHNDRDR